MVSINPANGKVNAEFAFNSPEYVGNALKKAQDGFLRWSSYLPEERAEYLENVASVLRGDKQELAETITMEMGKPLKQALGEVEKSASMFDHFARNAPSLLLPETMFDDPSSFISMEPMGTILAIKPWNYPFWQVLSAASHILAGGNTMLLKHSGYVPMCALKIEEIFRKAGIGEGVFQTLLISGEEASALISDRRINGVSFTGGTVAGQKVAQVCGKYLKKCVLELGGSDPFIVMEDADVVKAAKVGVSARFINTGQTCISSKRFIVQESVAEEFTDRFVEHTLDLVMGDPMEMDTDLGPLVRKESAISLESQVNGSISMGAQALVEGGIRENEGFYFAPVVLGGVSADMPVMAEETFGPVAPIIAVETEEEALIVANSTDYGLGASVWAGDDVRALSLARNVQSGVVGVNGFFKPEADMPFGGVKQSGIGRELSRFGFYEFMNIRSTKIY